MTRGYALAFRLRVLVLAGLTLAAGPMALAAEAGAGPQPSQAAQIFETSGVKGGLLWVMAADGGAKLAEIQLASPPVWDGMAVTGGRVYLSACDGSVSCLGAP